MSGFRGPLLKELTNVFVLHHVERRNVDSDIRLFLGHELSELARRPEGWPTDRHLDFLCHRAAGFFVYALATVNFLKHNFRRPSERLKVIMESAESTLHEGKVELGACTSLDSLYMSILREAFYDTGTGDGTMIRSVLSAVVLVINPLSPSAVATLMGFECDEVFSLLESVQSLLVLHEDITKPAQPFHKSFPDFITDPSRCNDPHLHISSDYQIKLALCCLRLMDRLLEKNICSIPDSTLNSEVQDLTTRIEESGIHGALKYACRSWHRHLVVTNYQAANVVSALKHFLEQKFLFWLEVLSVLGAVRDAAYALNATVKWLNEVWLSQLKNCVMLTYCKIQEFADINGLDSIVTDCSRFVTEFFEVISQSVPHIYQSALQFTPHSSVVWKLYNQAHSSGVRVMKGISASWDSCKASIGYGSQVSGVTWSPCGQLIATVLGQQVQIQNASTLEIVTVLKPSGVIVSHLSSPTFAPDGCLLACIVLSL